MWNPLFKARLYGMPCKEYVLLDSQSVGELLFKYCPDLQDVSGPKFFFNLIASYEPNSALWFDAQYIGSLYTYYLIRTLLNVRGMINNYPETLSLIHVCIGQTEMYGYSSQIASDS